MTNSAHHPPISAQDQFGLRLAARLDAASHDLSHDISERLRAARTRAVAARRAPQLQLRSQTSVSVQGGVGLLHYGGDEGLNLWSRLASLFPLLALVAGLMLIQHISDDDRANELAEVDSALLTDDLPPSAYADPGFLQFLKMPDIAAQTQD